MTRGRVPKINKTLHKQLTGRMALQEPWVKQNLRHFSRVMKSHFLRLCAFRTLHLFTKLSPCLQGLLKSRYLELFVCL